MKTIWKYLKPFGFTLALAVIFLFVQSIAELELPNQMSALVNTGIQASGVEEGAPQVISGDGFDLISLYTDDSTLEEGYTKIQGGSDEAKEYEKQFPKTASFDFYARKNDVDREKLDKAYNTAVYAFTLQLQEISGAQEENTELNREDADFSQIYQAMPMLMQAKESGALQPYIDQAKADDTMAAEQVAVNFSGLFYQELGADLHSFQMRYIWRRGAIMLGVTLIQILAAIFVGWLASKIAAQAAEKMRRDIFKKVGEFSSAEYDKFSTASLITRTTNDVQQVQQLLLIGIRMMFHAPILGIGGIIMAINTSLSLSWIIVVAVVALIGLVLVVMALALPKFSKLQKLTDRLNLVARENLSGMMVIRAFGNEQYEENRFDGANLDLKNTNLFVQRVMAFMMPAMMLLFNLISLLIVWVGANAIAASTLQIGSMMAFMQYTIQIIMSFLILSMVFIMVPRALVSAKRIQEVLNTDLTIKDKKDPVKMENTKGLVEFRDVSFRYDNAEEDVLHDLNFTATPGQTTAIIGSTGCGKSTMINLIPRFYDVTEGSVTIDGIDVRELDQQDLRDHIGFVPQKGMLFSGDIDSNVRYGKEDASQEEVDKSLEVSQSAEFVSELEQGINTAISQGGTNVSGGQRQRLSIARALIKKPPIYIFDDSFSALDLKTDAKLRKALHNFTADSTVIIVAQRVSTIMNAEQILVLDKGRIVGKGTHSQLLESCEEYREIAESQLSKEELA